MRAARVPASLAISSAAHYIVTATDRSESYQQFVQKYREQEQTERLQEQEQLDSKTHNKTNNIDSVKHSKSKAIRFRLHHLVAADWSELMHKCRGITHPANAYTISSPGDAGDVIANIFAENSENKSQSNNKNENNSSDITDSSNNSVQNKFAKSNNTSINSEVHVVNTAIMHIVERVPSDFVPNNLIYHRLRQYDIESTNWHGVIPGFDEFVCGLQHTTSENGLHTQNPKKVPESLFNVTNDREYTNETKDDDDKKSNNIVPENGNGENDNLDEQLNLSVNDKREHDALAHNSEAHIASVSNEEVGVYINTLIRQMQVNRELEENQQTTLSPETMILEAKEEKHKTQAEHAQTPHHSLTFTFYPHRIDALSCIPFCSKHFAVLVNLKPIVPLHLMVVPLRCVSTIHGLSDDEVNDWGNVVHLTISVLERIRQEKCSPSTKEIVATPLASTKTQLESAALGSHTSINTSKDKNASSNTKLNNDAVAVDQSTIKENKVVEEKKGLRTNNTNYSEKKQKEQEYEQKECGVVHDGGYSIAIQQGALAGQTVAHLHTHVIPFDPTGVLAGEPEYEGEAEAQRRPPRTVAEMRAETSYLRPYFAKL